jgi:hypothetical protein
MMKPTHNLLKEARTMARSITVRKSSAAPMMALALFFGTACAANVVTITPVEAGKVKIVKKGSKMVLKGIGKLGRKMSKSKVKVSRKAGKSIERVGKKGSKGIDKASRGIKRAVRKTKVGRKLDNARRNAGRWKTKQLNKAFRNNRGKAGRFAKNVVDLATPF